jgi:hypothetical protein
MPLPPPPNPLRSPPRSANPLQAAAKTVELRQDQRALQHTDLTYIRNKLDMVRRHAEEMQASVLHNPNVTSAQIAVRVGGRGWVRVGELEG